MAITLADVSEFQGNVDAPTYLAAGHHCLIARAHNGWRPDRMWPARRDYLRGHGFSALGWYQYLVAGKDAAEQAREFISTVGQIADNEFVILDHEEGAGNQTPRAVAWFAVVDAHYGRRSTLYAGEYFGNANLGGWTHWNRPRWMAAYQGVQPREPHELWQNTDRGYFPGIGHCDGSIFNGTTAQFMQTFCHMKGPIPSPHPKPALPRGAEMIASERNKDGRQERFVALHNGDIKHNWQNDKLSWVGWAGLGNVGGTPIGISANLNVHDCIEVAVYLADGDVKARWQKAEGGWSENWTGAGHPGA